MTSQSWLLRALTGYRVGKPPFYPSGIGPSQRNTAQVTTFHGEPGFWDFPVPINSIIDHTCWSSVWSLLHFRNATSLEKAMCPWAYPVLSNTPGKQKLHFLCVDQAALWEILQKGNHSTKPNSTVFKSLCTLFSQINASEVTSFIVKF